MARTEAPAFRCDSCGQTVFSAALICGEVEFTKEKVHRELCAGCAGRMLNHLLQKVGQNAALDAINMIDSGTFR